MGNSRQVFSNQEEPHDGLLSILKRREGKCYRRSPRRIEPQVWSKLQKYLEAFSGRIIVDVGCGTGESTTALAKENPCAFVLGVDKSIARLRKAKSQRGQPHNRNLLFIRAEIQDIWLHLKSAGVKPERQCFFYPNPWPKKKHLNRRLHAHPVFPVALSFGGVIELRTNWDIYAMEFASVVKYHCEAEVRWSKLPEGDPISAFEKKYLASGHSLYQLSAQISG